MAHPTVIIEGESKHRDAKKWRLRWTVLSKLSPVADCLHLQLYRNSKERCKNGPSKSSLSLEGFLGMETGFTLDKESNTMALICKDIVVILAFDTREMLIQWQVKIRAHLSEEQHFLVQITHVPQKSKLSCGPSRLHLQDGVFSLVSGIPPRLLNYWPLKELRRFGTIDGKFCFEGGSHCGKGEGLHILHTNQTDELERAFELASKGKLHGKRKAMLSKNQPIDGSVRMSLQHTKCTHKTCECDSGSGESVRPLLSSGSESSMCDACSEIIRFSCSNGDGELSSDEAYSRSTCCTTLRWSSNSSNFGGCGPAYASSASVVDDNECLFTPSPSLTVLNNSADNRRSILGLSNSIDSNTIALNQNDNRCSWLGDVCNKCSHHYCVSSNGCSDDINKTIDNSVSTIAASSSDLQFITPPASIDNRHHRHRHFNHNGSIKGKGMIPDRTSLCSQSSRSSSNSSNSGNGSISGCGICYVCTSEYSVPRSIHQQRVDMHYDRPKDVSHNTCRLRSKSESAALCSYHVNLMDLNMEGSVPIAHLGQTMTNAEYSYDNTGDLNNISNSVGNAHSTDAMCGCGFVNPMAHYEVPRTALANIYLKESKHLQMNDSHKHFSERRNTQSLINHYDIPRKFKNVCLKCQNSCICLVSSLPRLGSSITHENGISDCNGVLTHERRSIRETTQYTTAVIDQFMVCSCQKLDFSENTCNCIRLSMLNVTPKPENIIDHKHRHCNANNYITDIGDCETESIRGYENGQTLLTKDGVSQSELTQQCKDCNDIIIDSSHEKKRQYASAATGHNYVNMHFAESIALYENLEWHNGSIDVCDTRKTAKEKCLLPVPCKDKTNEEYELMSFNDHLHETKSIESNYMLMKPIPVMDENVKVNIENEHAHEYAYEYAHHSHHSHHSLESDYMNSQRYHTFKEHDKRNVNGICVSHHKSKAKEFKRNKLFRFRSHSIERENMNSSSVITDICAPSSCPSSPDLALVNNRRDFNHTKMQLKSKGKSLSIEDISPSMVSSVHNNRSLETLLFSHFHKSADCLMQKVDYRSSDDDLYTNSQITVLCPSPVIHDPLNPLEGSFNVPLKHISDGDTLYQRECPNRMEEFEDENSNDTPSLDMNNYIARISFSSKVFHDSSAYANDEIIIKSNSQLIS